MISSNMISRSLTKFFVANNPTSTLLKKSGAIAASQRLIHLSQNICICKSSYSMKTSQAFVGKRGFHSTGFLYKSESPETDQENPKLVPNEEWAKRLTPEQYFCAREGGTEPPFSGQYLNHKAEGLYTCVCCGSDVFTSKTKYDSGSGWPSFNAAVDDNPASASDSAVIRRKDISHGMVRNEIICKTCNAHLGHVFEDGPAPTGERFCVNSAALKFVPKKLS